MDLDEVARTTAGFTGAELANILNEAAIIATKKQHKAISNDDLELIIGKDLDNNGKIGK